MPQLTPRKQAIVQEVIDRPPALTRKNKEQPEPPKMYAVLLWNNASTSVHLVLDILVKVFQHSQSRAMQIVIAAHNGTRSSAGVYPKDIAETRVAQATAMARA